MALEAMPHLYMSLQSVFFPRAREKTWKNMKKCTWKHKSAREIFHKILPVKLKLMHVKKTENYARETTKVPVKKYKDYISSVFCKNMLF